MLESVGQVLLLHDPSQREDYRAKAADSSSHSNELLPKCEPLLTSESRVEKANGLSQHTLLRENVIPSKGRNQEAEIETRSKSITLRWSLRFTELF